MTIIIRPMKNPPIAEILDTLWVSSVYSTPLDGAYTHVYRLPQNLRATECWVACEQSEWYHVTDLPPCEPGCEYAQDFEIHHRLWTGDCIEETAE